MWPFKPTQIAAYQPPADDAQSPSLKPVTDWGGAVAAPGPMDLAIFAPDHWGPIELIEPNSQLRLDCDFLSEDFCIVDGGHFSIRATLEIPVHGIAEKFAYSCWASISRMTFETYIEGFDEGDYEDAGPWPAYLANDFPPFVAACGQRCWVFPQPDRARPTILLDDREHDLTIAQNRGISIETLNAIYAEHGHWVEA